MQINVCHANMPILYYLCAIIGDLLGLVEVQNGRREEEGERPRRRHQTTRAPPGAAEVHRVRDGVVAIDAQRHQHVRGRVGDHGLEMWKSLGERTPIIGMPEVSMDLIRWPCLRQEIRTSKRPKGFNRKVRSFKTVISYK